MSTDGHWTTKPLEETRAQHPAMTEAVTSLVTDSLKGEMSDQHLSDTELSSIATALIAGMVPGKPEPDEER